MQSQLVWVLAVIPATQLYIQLTYWSSLDIGDIGIRRGDPCSAPLRHDQDRQAFVGRNPGAGEVGKVWSRANEEQVDALVCSCLLGGVQALGVDISGKSLSISHAPESTRPRRGF